MGDITVAIDGTKILANPSWHSAVSYERAGDPLRQVELEIGPLQAKAQAERTEKRPGQKGQPPPAPPALKDQSNLTDLGPHGPGCRQPRTPRRTVAQLEARPDLSPPPDAVPFLQRLPTAPPLRPDASATSKAGKPSQEWLLVGSAYNLKRLFRLGTATPPA